jgi:Mrp family chromosome partitioning ATPase
MSAIQSPSPESRLTVLNLNGRAQLAEIHGQLVVRPGEFESRLVFASDPGGVAAEQYRLIRRKLVERYPDGGSLVVTSPQMGEGKTLTSTNLAWCFAESGIPTLLGEMDLRNPSMSQLLGYSPTVSSMATLLEDDPANGMVYQINDLPFCVAMSDARPNASGLLSTSRITRFLEWAKQNYKWVVLDSPPLFPFSDTVELSAAADFTILVVRAGVSSRTLVTRSIQLLGPRLQQVILNEASECADSPYRYLSAHYGTKK